MQKVIPGSSREALAFIGQHWKNLLLISLIPVACQIIVSYWQIHQMAGLYRNIGEIAPNGMPGPEFWSNYFKTMSWSGLGSILVGFLLAMMFSQIVRYRKGAAASLLPADKASWKAAGMTTVYAIGIVMLTMVAYIVVVFGVAIVAGILGFIFGKMGGAGAVFGALFVVTAIVGFLAFLMWFFFRFMVGLPGVALGHSPDFFKDLWALAKGESWAVPLRFLLAIIIAYIPLGILFGFAFTGMFDVVHQNPENPLAMMPAMADMMERMAPISVISALIMLPFNWFFMLLLAVSFDRFLGRAQVAK